eukprot:scaffold18203_cov90-Isochrysis_galbana.AAC.1
MRLKRAVFALCEEWEGNTPTHNRPAHTPELERALFALGQEWSEPAEGESRPDARCGLSVTAWVRGGVGIAKPRRRPALPIVLGYTRKESLGGDGPVAVGGGARGVAG